MMKFLRDLLVTILLLELVVGMECLMQTVRAAPEITILSHTGYIDALGYYHVVGELLNAGDGAVGSVKVEVAFYDSQNLQITQRFDLAMLNVVLPERKSPFDIVLLDEAQSTMVDHYVVNVTFSNTNLLPLGLQILTNPSYIDEVGSMHVNGTIKNVGDSATTNVKIAATFYNSTGQVVAAAIRNLELENALFPEQITPFDISLVGERAQYVNRYELAGESNEYAMIPEFSIQTLIAPIMIVIVMALAIRRHGRVIQ